ncbi:MAG: PH domain-containing protein [Blastocatellia bacterium]|nr:PH domain-containing protein [Blastocatellia bacterium]
MQFEPVPPETAPEPVAEEAPSVFEGRLHPLTLVFGLVRAGRGLLPMIPLVFIGGKSAYGYGAAILVASLATIAVTFAKYFSLRYRIENHELVIEQGLLFRRHRSIPLDRIQEIRIEQGVVQRVFDVVEAAVETGGGEGAEGKLTVLSRAEAERLRRAVNDQTARLRAGAGPVDAAPFATEERELRRVSVRELIVAGLTTNHLLSALALAGVLWNFADDFIPDSFYARVAKYAYSNAGRYSGRSLEATVLLAVAGLLALVVIGMVFSVVGSIVLFYGFRLTQRGEDLRRRYGLLTRRASSLPRRRIQVLELEEKLLRRLFGYATLRADTSGAKRDDKDDNHGRDVLLPIVPRDEADGLLAIVFPDLLTEAAEWRLVSPLAIRRGVTKGVIVCLLAAGTLFYFQRSVWALAPLALLPLIYWAYAVSYRRLGYAIGDGYLRTRRGIFSRSTHIVPLDKIQAVELQQTPFDKRLNLASVRIDTAGQAYTGGGPHIANLPIDEARALARTLAHRAAGLRYRW